MSKPKRSREAILMGFELDREILPALEEKIKTLKISKRKYLTDLILKDLGYTIIPAQVIPPKLVRIERDEESV
jgi:hypothetical protein